MHMQKARRRLRWRGAQTVEDIAKRMSRGEEVIVLLPPSLHHALCVRVGADERAHGLVNATLDAESFERLTHIPGLRELEALREPLERAGMSVRVRTPPPQLLFVERAARRRHGTHRYQWKPAAALAAS